MKEIIGKLNELVMICEARVIQCKTDADANASQASKNAIEAKSLEALRKDLTKREKRVKELEDIADAQKELVAIREKVKDEVARIAKEWKEFDEHKVSENKKVDDQRSILKAREDKLSQAEMRLDEDKRTYKVKIIEQVNREQKLKK